MRLPIPRSPLTGALSAVAALSLGGVGLALHTSSGNAASASTRTVTVSKGVVQSTASGTGNLAAANELTLNFGTSGTVSKVYVKEGEHVSQGQLIARLDSDSQKVALAQAKATLASAQDAADSASTASTASASDADAATTTDAVLGQGTQVRMIDAADTATTPAATTPTATATTPADASGATGAAGSTGTSGSAAGSSTTTSGTAAATGSAAASGGGSGTSGSGGGSGTSSGSGTSAASGASGGGSGASASGSGSASSTTSAASAAAQVESDELAVKEAQAALDDTELRAPVAGTIVSLSGSVGDSVSAGSTSSASSAGSSASSSGSSSSAAAGGSGGSSTGASTSSSSGFATLSQLSKLSMSVSFSESDIGKVKVGQAATVTVSAADDVQLAARVTKIGLVASTSNSVVSYPVELTITQNAAGVLAGMSATAEIVVEQATGVLNVPTQALSGKSVTVIKDGERTTQQVTTGITGTSTTQIVSGLSAGDVVALPTLSATSTTSASTSSTSRRSGTAAGGLGGGTGAAGGFGGGAGFGGGTGGPPTR